MKRNKRKSPALAANKRRRRRKSSKRRLRANKGTSAGAKKGWATRRRRKKAAKKGTSTKKRRRKARAKSASPKRRRKRKLKANARKTTTRRRRKKARRRTSTRRRKSSKKRRSKARAASPKRRRRRKKASAKMTSNPRRRRRRKGRSMKSNRRRSMKSNRRRRHRRNGGRSMFRRNTGLMGALKTGAMIFGGFGAHRVLTNLFDQQVMMRLLPAPAAPAEPAASGLGQISQHSKTISAIIVAGLGSFAVSKVVKDDNTKKLLIGGFVLSALHSVVMGILNQFAPTAANMLAGPEDGTAARISAMYGMRGLGAGASIMPHYAAINGGMGEYFASPMNGMGEYFASPMNGMGEYLAVQGMQGVGTYERNPNLLEAAAGMGQYREVSGNHIDPSSDLDQQLTIAEAAAGVGNVSPFEAAAGLQPFEASAGMGAIDTVPSSSTWIPGSTNPQLWAGVRPVDRPQSATEMVPAGILQTDGGQGIFG
jgi:hypothetical protein